MPDSPIERLVESFRRFPGIGPRQARRFVYYLLRSPHQAVDQLVRQIQELKSLSRQCERCRRYFVGNNQACDVCSDESRDATLLMVVEKDIDLENVRAAGVYQGQFFVLGGLVPILEKEPEKFVRLRELERRLSEDKNIKEVILAFAANETGDHTVEFLRSKLKSQNSKLTLTTLGRGLSTGTELEYSDADTLKNALRHREST